MRKRDSASLALCPLLLRIALGVIFLYNGLNKLKTIEFEGESAQRLVAMRIGKVVHPATSSATAPAPTDQENQLPQPAQPEDQPGASDEGPPQNTDEQTGDQTGPADSNSDNEESTADGAAQDNDAAGQGADDQPSDTGAGNVVRTGDDTRADSSTQDSQPQGDKASGQQPDTGTSTGTAAGQPGNQSDVVVMAPALEHITLMLDKAGHPMPHFFGWMAMITEALGGAMLLIGLMARFWGMGLVITMIYAAALTTIPAWHDKVDPNASTVIKGWLDAFPRIDLGTQRDLFFQFSLLVSAACIVIGGAGTISLDRILFGSSSSK